MQIQDLVEYCDSSYARGVDKCETCSNPTCEGACARCFNSIHQVGNIRDYDCPNLMYHYVCTYLYAYSSEIYHLCNADTDVKNLDEYRVLSIGCGPTSELFGINKIANGKKVTYKGFDINNLWADIHKKVTELASKDGNCEAEMKIANVFTEFDSINFKPNMIVLSYIISHLAKNGINVNQFMDDLKTNILDKIDRPYFILINDINLNTPRDNFPILYQKLWGTTGISVSCRCFSFAGYNYGTRHTSRALIEPIPNDILVKYQTWQQCKKTAQMLLKVN